MNINFDDWEAEQMLDPEFRAIAEKLESTYQIARRLLQLQYRQFLEEFKERAMDYEYVALSWSKEHPENDEPFARRKAKRINQGWQVYVQAVWENTYGGACIMRRPKDEPRKCEQHGVVRELQERLDEIVAQYERRMLAVQEVRRHEDGAKRPVDQDKDEPRLWTERDIQELIYLAQWKARVKKEK